MRIVRLKLRKEVSLLLAEISKEIGVTDLGFSEDVFSLMRLKGNGLPDPARIELMADAITKNSKLSKIGAKLLMSKRKMILERMIGLAYFKSLAAQKDLVLGVKRLLISFKTLYYKQRQSQCMSCKLRNNCDFGKQYGNSMTDITKVIDPDFQIKAHQDCPVIPEISFVNQFDAAMQSFLQFMAQQNQALTQAAGANVGPASGVQALTADDPDPQQDGEIDPESANDDYVPSRGDGSGDNTGYNNTHTGQHICQVTEAFINQVTNAQLLIFELGRNFDLALQKAKNANFKPVPQVEHDQNQDQIKSESEVSKLVSSQHGLPEEVYDARLKKKQLIKREYQKPDDKKQLLYLLVDSSGSMSGQLVSNSRYNLYTRGILATVFSLSLARKVKADKGIMFLRFFEGSPSMLHKATSAQDFDDLFQVITKNNYGGGGTDIPAALQAAVTDIERQDAEEALAKSEILLITDCEQALDKAMLKTLLKKHECNVLDVSGGSHGTNQALKALAKNYYKADEAAVDVNKLVALL